MPDYNRHGDGGAFTFGDPRDGWECRVKVGKMEADGRAGYGLEKG